MLLPFGEWQKGQKIAIKIQKLVRQKIQRDSCLNLILTNRKYFQFQITD